MFVKLSVILSFQNTTSINCYEYFGGCPFPKSLHRSISYELLITSMGRDFNQSYCLM
jgi:hypothetical protein